jgi:hypothetical protein
MTTSELLETLASLRSVLASDNTVYTVVDNIIDRGRSLIDLNSVFSYGNEQSAAMLHSRETLARFAESVKATDLRRFFLALDDLVDSLSSHLSTICSDAAIAKSDELTQNLRLFESGFQAFIRSSSYTNAIGLYLSAISVVIAKRGVSSQIDLITCALTPASTLGLDEMDIHIAFYYYADSLDRFETRIRLIHELYNELNLLIGLSVREYPLRIKKIESGSEVLHLIGHYLPVALLGWVLKKAVGYIHRNYTTEGQIAAIPRQVDSADRLLEFSSKLAELGVDVSESKDNLNKFLATAGSKLNKLIAPEPRISIDGEDFRIANDPDKYLASADKALLGSGTDEQNGRIDQPKE